MGLFKNKSVTTAQEACAEYLQAVEDKKAGRHHRPSIHTFHALRFDKQPLSYFLTGLYDLTCNDPASAQKYFLLAAKKKCEPAAMLLAVNFHDSSYTSKKYARPPFDSTEAKLFLCFYCRLVCDMDQQQAMALYAQEKLEYYLGTGHRNFLGGDNFETAEKNPRMAQALTLFEKAADMGNVKGMLLCGTVCELGESKGHTSKQALQWYCRAAESGSLTGKARYFRTCERLGIPADHKDAAAWKTQVAAQNAEIDAQAESLLPDALADWLQPLFRKGYDHAFARYFYAERRLGRIQPDILNTALSFGVPDAFLHAIWCVLKGKLTPVTGLGYVTLFHNRANAIGPDSVYTLQDKAVTLPLEAYYLSQAEEIFTAMDLQLSLSESAYRHYQAAAALGNTEAMLACGALCAAEEVKDHDKHEALSWYMKAARAGDLSGMRRSAVILTKDSALQQRLAQEGKLQPMELETWAAYVVAADNPIHTIMDAANACQPQSLAQWQEREDMVAPVQEIAESGYDCAITQLLQAYWNWDKEWKPLTRDPAQKGRFMDQFTKLHKIGLRRGNATAFIHQAMIASETADFYKKNALSPLLEQLKRLDMDDPDFHILRQKANQEAQRIKKWDAIAELWARRTKSQLL